MLGLVTMSWPSLVAYPHCRLVFMCSRCGSLVPCSFPVCVVVLLSCVVVMRRLGMWLSHTMNSDEQQPMSSFIVWCLMSASWVGMGWGVLTVVSYCRSSFGCHVAGSDMAPGFRYWALVVLWWWQPFLCVWATVHVHFGAYVIVWAVVIIVWAFGR